jgi:hypothetical protein
MKKIIKQTSFIVDGRVIKTQTSDFSDCIDEVEKGTRCEMSDDDILDYIGENTVDS